MPLVFLFFQTQPQELGTLQVLAPCSAPLSPGFTGPGMVEGARAWAEGEPWRTASLPAPSHCPEGQMSVEVHLETEGERGWEENQL